ncbi:MAG: diguanylate cyclase [Bacillota bacterium]
MKKSGNKTDGHDMVLPMNDDLDVLLCKDSLLTPICQHKKCYQTLVAIGDAIMVVNMHGGVEFLNPMASELTGWTLEDVSGVSYKKIFLLSGDRKGVVIQDSVEKVLMSGKGQKLTDYAILTSKKGVKYFIEGNVSPIIDTKGKSVGAAIAFRDISEKKEERTKIEYLSYHDYLTGLYNRRYFEEELNRLDTKRNLPISILMGDVNGLKLINDIFGHSYGDKMLKEVAGIMQNECRSDDIIARWGGDEFVMLLPKTDLNEAEKIALRIKNKISTIKDYAIEISISIGCDSKTHENLDMIRTLNKAETKMYYSKTLEKSSKQCDELEAIVNLFFENYERERQHAEYVSKMSREVGIALNLSQLDIQKLMKVGRLHNIGKVILEPGISGKEQLLKLSEYKVEESHPLVGYRILSNFDDTLELADIVLAHHENWDGSGFPKRLKGEKIPLMARIINIVGSFEQMIHSSGQATVKSYSDAILEIKNGAGTKFDPKIVDVFIELLHAKKGN